MTTTTATALTNQRSCGIIKVGNSHKTQTKTAGTAQAEAEECARLRGKNSRLPSPVQPWTLDPGAVLTGKRLAQLNDAGWDGAEEAGALPQTDGAYISSGAGRCRGPPFICLFSTSWLPVRAH
ncbi:hypothetical protein ACOMHN_017311 [Nucella lapillus]